MERSNRPGAEQYADASLLDVMEELIYIADVETYELLFVNEAAKKSFGLGRYEGLKCYRALQGRDAPCEFCINRRLKPGEVYRWDFKNLLLNRWFQLKDKLITFRGHPAKIEVAFDVTEREEQKEDLENALEAEKSLTECIRMLHDSSDLHETLDAMLARVGSLLVAERSYIFEVQGKAISNTYEWCAPGIQPQIQNLQSLDISVMERWLPYFRQHQCVTIADVNSIRESNPTEYRIMTMQGIRSYVTAPLEMDGQLVGFLGVDNPPVQKSKNIAALLLTLGYFVTSAIQRSANEKLLERLSYTDTMTGAANRNAFIRDMERYQSSRLMEQGVGVAYFDLNGLKEVNDRYGHAVGDQKIIALAKTLTAFFGEGEVYRTGGDEFVIVSGAVTREAFEEKVGRLVRCIEEGDMLSVSVGTSWSDSSVDVNRLILQADKRMYVSKNQYHHRQGEQEK